MTTGSVRGTAPIDDNPMFPYGFWGADHAIVDDGISVLFPNRQLHWRTGRLGYTVVEYDLPDHLRLRIDYGPFSF